MEGHPFNTLHKAVELYKFSSPTESHDQMDLMLYCWGLLHGISVLIASNEIPFVADYSKLIFNIFDSDKF
jgi:hypothetical protein